MNYSKYQTDIFDYASNHNDCIAVNAVAGSGKTTTAIEVANRLSGTGRFMAFNTHIAEELSSRILTTDCMTYNAFGWRILLKHLKRRPKLSKYKTWNVFRYKVLKNKDSNIYYKYKNILSRIIELCKNMNYKSQEEISKNLSWLEDHYDLSIPSDPKFIEYLLSTWTFSVGDLTTFDFTDQKFMPLYLGLEIPKSDWLIIDEYQDTCNVESELMLKSANRIIIVGDPDQCIYSFKGTTPNAMEKFINERHASQLPLSISYRCSSSVINEAQKIVPRIEASPTASKGYVGTAKDVSAQNGDFVLCRVTADLVKSCLNFAKRGIPSYVLGREIGQQFTYFVESLADDHTKINDFKIILKDYKEAQSNLSDSKLLSLEDKCSALSYLSDGVSDVLGLKQRIEKLFTDEQEGIKHLTIHKSKGLEAKNCFLLRPDLLPHPRATKDWMKEEEKRLKYVAITRAKENFIYVSS